MIKLSGKKIQGQNFIDFLESNSNLIKIALIGFEEIIKSMYEDVEQLKGVPLKPDRKTALALLEYISWENSGTKKTVETLCGQEFEKYFEWLNAYCAKYKCTQEQALTRIIE